MRRRASAKREPWDPPIPQRDELDAWDAPRRKPGAAIEPDEIFDSWDDAPKRKKEKRDQDDLFDV